MLQEQMEDRRKLEEMARAEFERDRELVDAVMAAIEEEDRLHGELKRAKAAETRRYIADFIADRDARREAERRAEFENERKIQVCPLRCAVVLVDACIRCVLLCVSGTPAVNLWRFLCRKQPRRQLLHSSHMCNLVLMPLSKKYELAGQDAAAAW